MSEYQYPYQDLSVETIKGEKWKDIPGLEMYFQVSNYGRIKRMPYELKYSDGRVYLKTERVIKPVVVQLHNHYVGDDRYFIRITLTLFKRKYNFSIARLVYHSFIKPFDMEDPDTLILTKDGNGLNISIDNLKMANHHDKQKRIFDLGRKEIVCFSPESRQRSAKRSLEVNGRQVTKYSMDGKRIITYRAISIAAKNNGISHSQIVSCVSGRELSAHGFIWSYQNVEHLDLAARVEKRKNKILLNKARFGKKITQYTMDGKRVATYPTINDAYKNTGVKTSEISRVIRKKRKSAGGYYWTRGYGPENIDLSGLLYGDALRAKKRCRKVEQYSPDGVYIQTFDSLKEAGIASGISPTTIICALNGRQKKAAGFIWKRVIKESKK